MAVILQKLVGRTHEGYFYPDFAGVARSYNLYPVLGMTPRRVSLGRAWLRQNGGRGGEIVFVSHRQSPQTLPQFSSTKEILENAQREFYALDMQNDPVPRRVRRLVSSRSGTRRGARNTRPDRVGLLPGQRCRLRRDLAPGAEAGDVRRRCLKPGTFPLVGDPEGASSARVAGRSTARSRSSLRSTWPKEQEDPPNSPSCRSVR